jgi:CDP-diacylglycerol--glycerol-3-phosphate 3-phosphatidyltransferase
MNAQFLALLPNAITLARLLSAPVLAWLAWSQQSVAFAVLLAAALASDVLDGWLARKLGVVSSRGASLDSVADILVVVAMLYAIWPLHPEVYLDHGWVIIGVALVWLICHAASLIRYGRLASFHTHLIRAGIFAFSAFALVLFLVGFHPWLLYLAAVICTLGALEHFVMLALLPEWTPNLHRGIPDALRLRRAAESTD